MVSGCTHDGLVFSSDVACICRREAEATLKKLLLASWSRVGGGCVLFFGFGVGSEVSVEAILVSDVSVDVFIFILLCVRFIE